MGIITEELRAKKEKQFRQLCDEVFEKANRKLEEKGQAYNKGGIDILDYGNALEDRVKTRFVWIWENTLRIKAEVNSNTRPLNDDKIIDLINQCRFLYAAVKMTEE